MKFLSPNYLIMFILFITMDIGHVGKTTIENRDRENCHIQSFTFHNIRVPLKVFLADGHQCSSAGPAYPANILSALLDPILSRSNDYTTYLRSPWTLIFSSGFDVYRLGRSATKFLAHMQNDST